MDKESLKQLIAESFNDLNESLQNSLGELAKAPADYAPNAAAAINGILGTIISMAYILITLFFIIDLCNKTLMFETSNYEVTVKLILRFILAKVIVENCKGIMDVIFTSFGDVIETLLGIGSGSGSGSSGSGSGITSPSGDSLLTTLESEIDSLDGGFLGINYIIYWLQKQPVMWLLKGAGIACGVIVIGRMFEIMIYTAIAPLPLSTLAGETAHDTAKRFLQNYIAVCLQGLIIIMAFKIFGGIISDVFSGSISTFQYLILIIVFMLTLFKSGTWAKQIVGAM